MKTLVWVEHDNASMKDATLAAVTAAGKLGDVDVLVAGKGARAVAEQAAKIAGVGKVLLADDIASRMQPMGSVTKSAQPILQTNVTAVPRSHAQAAYGRNAMRQATPPAAPAGSPASSPSGSPAEAAAPRAHVQPFDQTMPQTAAPRLPGAYGKP